MTYKKALDWCDQFENNLVLVDVDKRRRNLALQAMRVCKAAIEKQIPKKPKEDGWLYCPVCGKDVLMDRYIFCPDCGQALDWSDTE